MSAVTADRNTKKREGLLGEHPIAATTKIYAGTLTMRDATGYLKNGANTASHVFAGVAREYKDNSAGAAGALYAQVTKKGVFLFETSSTLTVANIGTKVYLADNQTVALAGDVTPDIWCGIIVDIEGGKPWVRIDEAADQA